MILPGARLRQVGREDHIVGPRDRADLLDDVILQLGDEQFGPLRAFLQRHEGRDRLPLDLVRSADDRRFGDTRMIDERALHFHRADAMSRHVQHVVHAAEQPEEPVRVPLRAVAGEIHVRRPAAPGTCFT